MRLVLTKEDEEGNEISVNEKRLGKMGGLQVTVFNLVSACVYASVFVCLCACARARARARVCVCVCVTQAYMYVLAGECVRVRMSV